MAKCYHQYLQAFSGKLGPITFRTASDGSTVVARSIERNNSRTMPQQRQRMQFANIAAIYKICRGLLDLHFGRRKERQSVYNAFVSANLAGTVKVYMSKQMKQMGGSILAPYCISMGSLPSIDVHRDQNAAFVSNIAMGSLSIGPETTVAELSKAIVNHNESFIYGDSIAFMLGTQNIDSITDTPRVRMYRYEVTLSRSDKRKLWSVVSCYGFQSLHGRLASRSDMPEGALAWIHLRPGHATEASTQHLVMNSTLYEHYTTESAFLESASTYGGIDDRCYAEPAQASDPFMYYPPADSLDAGDDTPSTPTPLYPPYSPMPCPEDSFNARSHSAFSPG